MTTLRPLYSSSVGITITLASMVSGAAQESTVVDNSADPYIDCLVQLKVKLVTGTPGGEKAVYVFVYGSEDGADLTDNVTGVDAVISLRQPTNLRLLGVIHTPDSGGLTYASHPMSLLSAFGGLVIPRKWGIVVWNLSGLTFDGTEGNFRKGYTGVRLLTT